VFDSFYFSKMVKRSFSDAFSQPSAVPQTSISKAEKRKHSSAFEEEDEIQPSTKRIQKCQPSAVPQTIISKAEKRKHSSAFQEEDEIQSLTEQFEKCKVKVASTKPTLDVAASFVEVLGNLVSSDFVLQGKNENEVINFAAKGEEWQHLFAPERARLLKQIVTVRSCSKNGIPVTEQQKLALFDSFRKVKSSLRCWQLLGFLVKSLPKAKVNP
jgi:hypothetical protein